MSGGGRSSLGQGKNVVRGAENLEPANELARFLGIRSKKNEKSGVKSQRRRFLFY